MGRKVPDVVVFRLAAYRRALRELPAGAGRVSSKTLAALTGYSAAQIRKDLSLFGQFGQPGVGYSVPELEAALVRIFGLEGERRVALVGVGNLGAALLAYRGFRESGFRIVAAFDVDPRKVGSTVAGVRVRHVADLERVVRGKRVELAVITVPAAAAQEVADAAVRGGVRGILNFAPAVVRVPDGVLLRNVDLGAELERLSCLVNLRGED